MSTLLLLVSVALAGKWDGRPTDVVAERVVRVPASDATTALADLSRMARIIPADCIGSWEVGQRTAGEGATAMVRYDIGLMHRSLALTVSRVVPGRYVDWDHPGRKGFVTRYALETLSNGSESEPPSTRVTATSYFSGPPWPLKRYYHTVMMPEWQACQARTLEALEATLASSGGAAVVK